MVLMDVNGPAVEDAAAAIGDACKDRHRVQAVTADVTRAGETAAAITQAVLGFGGLDILVANAGFVEAGPIDEISEQAWDRHFEVNVKGYFLAVREAVRVMKLAGRGVILLNASKGAFAPTVDNAAYASSKAAVAALTRNLAAELGPHGIRVNALNADFVDTPLMRGLIAQRAALKGITPEQQAEEYRQRNLLNVGPIPPRPSPRRRCSWCPRAPPTPPAPLCRSTAASKRRCPADPIWRDIALLPATGQVLR